MKAIPNQLYAQIVDGKAHWLFTHRELPEWSEDITVVPIEEGEAQIGDLWDGANWTPAPSRTLSGSQALAREAIDQAAGRARARYITTVPGQEGTYLLKEQHARAFKAAGYQGQAHPFISQEAAATGRTAQQTADLIIANADLWVNTVGPAIEAARIGGKKAVDDAQSIAAVEAARNAAVGTLNAI